MVENPAGSSDIDIHVDEESGRRYSVNNSTGETKWMDDDKEEAKPKKKSSRKKDTADESHQRTTTELPDGWTKEVRDGRDYYANRKTKESSWKPPPGSTGGSASAKPKIKSRERTKTELPDGWSSESSKDGKKYYANRTSKETSWKPPPGSTGGSSLARPRRKSARKTEGMVKGKKG